MALLPSATHSNSNTSYYALATNAGGAVETAGAFIATGVGAPDNGLFIANKDAVAGGNDVFTIATSAGTTQWSIGVANVQAPGNVGNDFAIFAYDNSGDFLNGPMNINRATGTVNFPVNATVAGVNVQKSQTDFIQTVSAPLPDTLPAGVNQYDMSGVFQVPKTGLYLIEGYLTFNAGLGTDTFVCDAGDFIGFQLQPNAPIAPGALSGGVDVDVTPVPASAAPTDRAWSNTSIVKLTGGQNYQAIAFTYNLSNSMEATGNAVIFATLEITSLCS